MKKKWMKKILALLLILAVSMAMLPVQDSSIAQAAAKKKVTSLTVKSGGKNVAKKTISMNTGGKKTLSVSTEPKAASKKASFKSSKPSVVSVSKKGVLTAKSAGTAKITVTVSSKKYQKKTTWVKVKASAPAKDSGNQDDAGSQDTSGDSGNQDNAGDTGDQGTPGGTGNQDTQTGTDTGPSYAVLNNGVRMPLIGFGTQTMSLENGSLQVLNDTSYQSVSAALAAGYRHLDTAHLYYNEYGVGQAIKDSGIPREEIWLTSKLAPSELGEGTTYQAINDMLKRLDVEYVDLLYIHHPMGDYAGAWKDMEKAYREGKVRALGISNFDNRMEAFNAIVETMEIKPQVMQIECHPFAQRKEARELAEKYNIQVECWYPLKHADSELLNNSVLSEIASAHGKSVVQVILRWHLQEGFSAVPGSTNPAHIAENYQILDFALSDTEMGRIRGLDQGESGRAFNIAYNDAMLSFFTPRAEYDTFSFEPSERKTTETPPTSGKKTAVLYYSASGTTRSRAQEVQKAIGEDKADLIEIVPKDVYTSGDLNWTSDSSRVTKEHAQTDADGRVSVRPELSDETKSVDLSKYDLIIIGYPIWWYDASWVAWSFLDYHKDSLSGKRIVPFCTSASSSVDKSVETLKAFYPQMQIDGENAARLTASNAANWGENFK